MTQEAVNISEDQNNKSEAGSAGTAKRFRKTLRIIGILIVLSALVLWAVFLLSRPSDRTNAAYSNFEVEEGQTRAEVAQGLYENGLIRNPSAFVLLSKISLAGEYRPGTYYLSPSQDSLNIIHLLTRGLTTSQGFTIPAGLTLDQIATELDRDGIADRDKFLEAASSADLKQIDLLSDGLDKHPDIKGSAVIEGFLLPMDYTLSTDADESMMIITMIDAFSNFYVEEYRDRAEEMGMSARDILAIASVIEEQTSVDSERAKISAVIHNRYNLELTAEDEIPEVPLCNPSRESILAALYPEDNEDIYFVLSPKLDGTHRFTADEAEYQQWLEEYEAAVQKDENPEETEAESN